jgi:hypothetical protein
MKIIPVVSILFSFVACDSAVSTLSADSTRQLIYQISRELADTDSLLRSGVERTDSIRNEMAIKDSLFQNGSPEYFDQLNLDSLLQRKYKKQNYFPFDTLSIYK